MKEPRYSKRSMENLTSGDQDIQTVFIEALKTGLIDISIIEGRRDKEKQNEYYRTGKSRLKWPEGKHNVLHPADLAQAVDAAPFINGRVSWDKIHCVFMAGVVLATAHRLGVKMRWGGNWDMDMEPVTDQDFQDLVHFETVK